MYTPSHLFSSSCIFDTLLHVHAFKPILPSCIFKTLLHVHGFKPILPSCIFDTLLHVHAFKPILPQLYIWYVTPCTRLQTYSPPVVYLIRYSMYTTSNLFAPVVYLIRYSMYTPSNLFSPSCIFDTLLHVHAFKPILLQLYIWYVTPCTRLQTYSPPVVYLIRYSMYTPSTLFSSSCIFDTLLHVHAFKPILLQLYI